MEIWYETNGSKQTATKISSSSFIAQAKFHIQLSEHFFQSKLIYVFLRFYAMREFFCPEWSFYSLWAITEWLSFFFRYETWDQKSHHNSFSTAGCNKWVTKVSTKNNGYNKTTKTEAFEKDLVYNVITKRLLCIPTGTLTIVDQIELQNIFVSNLIFLLILLCFLLLGYFGVTYLCIITMVLLSNTVVYCHMFMSWRN